MSTNSEQNRGLISRMSDKYRLVILEDDTLGEVKTTKITGMGILFSLLGLFIMISLLCFVLISYTPIRYLVPGYADINNNRAYNELKLKLDEIEKELDAQKIYTNGLKNMLNPSGDLIKDLTDKNPSNNNFKSFSEGSNRISLNNYYFCPPLKGEISAAFDAEGKHFGIDIVAEKDSPVKCILDGVVISSDWSIKTGNTISVQHHNDLISVYKHNSALLKNVGQNVKTGEAIAIIGNTGILTNGPHVHFELWQGGRAMNPADYINFN